MDTNPYRIFFRVKNFKSLKDAELEIKPLTLLFGANGSGKSSFLKALKYLKSNLLNIAKGSELKSNLDLDTNLGDYAEIVNNGKVKNRILLEIEVTSEIWESSKEGYRNIHNSVLMEAVRTRNQNLIQNNSLPSFSYDWSENTKYTIRDLEDDGSLEFIEIKDEIDIEMEKRFKKQIDDYEFEEIDEFEEDFHLYDPTTSISQETSPSELIFPFRFLVEISSQSKKPKAELVRYENTYDGSFLEIYLDGNRTMSVFNDVRLDSHFKQFYDLWNSRPFMENDISTFWGIVKRYFFLKIQNESFWKHKSYTEKKEILYKFISWYYIVFQYIPESVNELLSNIHLPTTRELPAEFYKLSDGDFEKKDYYEIPYQYSKKLLGQKEVRFINKYLKIFNIAQNVRVKKEEKVGYLQYKPIDANIYIHLRQGSSGMLQVFPILFYSTLNKNLLIEQPELHLHPRLQAYLAEVFLHSLKEDNDSKFFKYFIIETHSEHLIRKIQVLLAQDKIQNDDLAVYYFNSQKNLTSIKKLWISEDGMFKETWPEGFFDEASNLAYALLEAQINRKN